MKIVIRLKRILSYKSLSLIIVDKFIISLRVERDRSITFLLFASFVIGIPF